jgi:intracellular septation protein
MKAVQFFSKFPFKRLLMGSLLEFGPVVLFLLSFEYLHVYKATIVLMITTIVSTVATFKVQKRLPYLALYMAFLTSIFGYITLTLHQPRFIQMRDTLYDVTCALTLMIGLMIRVPFLQLAFNAVVPMTRRAWNNLTYLWIGFFLFAATANEYVRTHFILQQWFDFKSIILFITLAFGSLALYATYEKEKN